MQPAHPANHRRDAWAILFLVGLPFVYFFPVTLGQGVWFTRDISRAYHPFAVELARALSEGRLPLWTPFMQAGFPLVAEGQVAAFYLPQLLLVSLLPAHFAISYEMLLHLAFAAVGMYVCVRGMGLGAASGLAAGVAFSFSGFMIQKLYHTPVLFTAAWLPWLVFLLERWQRAINTSRIVISSEARNLVPPTNNEISRSLRSLEMTKSGVRGEHVAENQDARAGLWFLLCVLAVAMQWLAGSAQIALLNLITSGTFGLYNGWILSRAETSPPPPLKAALQSTLWTAIPIILGTAIAAIQLVPTAELLGYSTRARGLDDKLLNLYSYSSDSLAQFVFPFSQGEPSDDNVELWGYVGLSTLLFALAALRLRRDVRTVFWFVFALVALSLTIGAANPLFQLLSRLPVFNLFRVPARYVFPFTFAAILLAATAFDELTKRLPTQPQRGIRLPIGISLVIVVLMLAVLRFAYTQSIEFWLSAWNVLPWVIGAVAVILLALGWARRVGQRAFQVMVVGLVLCDMAAYAAVFLSTTVGQLTPPANVTSIPRTVPFLGTPNAPERVLTDETIWPSVPALRASLYPNFGMLYGREMAHAYTPLWFDANENYFFNLTPAMLNLLNVRYFLIPLEPRLSDRRPAPFDSLALDLIKNQVEISPTLAAAIQVDSFTEETATLEEYSTIAELAVSFDDGSTQAFPIRIGIETADWDYTRTRTQKMQAPLARTISGFVRSFGRTFDGGVYRARFDLSPARRIVALSVRALIPPSHITIERISLVDEKGVAMSLASLAGRNQFALRYMSDTAAIWENENVLPRAFIAHRAIVMSGDQVFDALREPDFRPDQTVLLSEGQPLDALDPSRLYDRVEVTSYSPERISISVEADREGYLVLSDTYYPGWAARVDGEATLIYRADMIFRAIAVQAGQHTVVFEYRPASLMIGAAISAAALLISISIAFMLGRKR